LNALVKEVVAMMELRLRIPAPSSPNHQE